MENLAQTVFASDQFDPVIDRLVFRKWCATVMMRLDISAPARKKPAVETTRDLCCVTCFAHRRNEQRDCVCRSGNGVDVVIACDVGRNFAFGSMNYARRDADEGTLWRHVVLAIT